MAVDGAWKQKRAARQAALERGEETARIFPFTYGPVDPFQVVRSERELIHIEGDDFRDCFDGRLSFHEGRFLLVYNTKYDAWPKQGPHHPKVRFTVAHELGHFYLDRHREFLVKRRRAIESITEFEADAEVERQADAFAAGLLMPRYLVGPLINTETEPTIDSVKSAAAAFDVSLTSMMVRWTQLSHFPCAAICVRRSQIQWAFVSEGFSHGGFWRGLRGTAVRSADALRFLQQDPSFSTFREDSGSGYAHNWLEGEANRIAVQEHYLAIPYSQCMMVFLTADEEDVPYRWGDDDSD